VRVNNLFRSDGAPGRDAPSSIEETQVCSMRKSVLPIAIAAATMAMASAFLSTTPAGGETKTLESVALADANWAVLGKPAAPVVNGASGYCLGVQGTAATAGALIAGRHCAGDPAQAWSVRASVTTAAGRAAT